MCIAQHIVLSISVSLLWRLLIRIYWLMNITTTVDKRQFYQLFVCTWAHVSSVWALWTAMQLTQAKFHLVRSSREVALSTSVSSFSIFCALRSAPIAPFWRLVFDLRRRIRYYGSCVCWLCAIDAQLSIAQRIRQTNMRPLTEAICNNQEILHIS